jgi:hypothetical protein
MTKSKPISYSVDEKIKKEIDHYAKIKGHGTASILSKFAVISHMRRHPLKKNELMKEDDN